MTAIVFSDSGIDGLTFTRPSLTKQHFADECDLSKIVSRFLKTGELPNLAVRTPSKIQDASLLPVDFQALQETIVDVKRRFESEPLELREKLLHDVERYIEYSALNEEQRKVFLGQTPVASPEAPPVASPEAPPVASPEAPPAPFTQTTFSGIV